MEDRLAIYEMVLLIEFLKERAMGSKNKIKGYQIIKELGIKGDSRLRKLIQLINKSKEFDEVIGAESGMNGGYYICLTLEEMRDTINNRRHRANEMLRNCHIMEWKSKRYLGDVRTKQYQDFKMEG